MEVGSDDAAPRSRQYARRRFTEQTAQQRWPGGSVPSSEVHTQCGAKRREEISRSRSGRSTESRCGAPRCYGGVAACPSVGTADNWNKAPRAVCFLDRLTPDDTSYPAAAEPTALRPATAAETSRNSSSQPILPPPSGRSARDRLACASCNAEASLRNASGRRRRRLRPRVRAEAKSLVTPRRRWCGALGERVRRDVVVSEGHGKKSARKLTCRLLVLDQSCSDASHRGRQGPWEVHCAAPLYVRLRS